MDIPMNPAALFQRPRRSFSVVLRTSAGVFLVDDGEESPMKGGVMGPKSQQ